MSKLLQIAGILLVAIGIALGLSVYFASGSMQVLGLTFEVAAIFLVGGVLSVGLGSVVSAIDAAGTAPRRADATAVAAAVAAGLGPEPRRCRLRGCTGRESCRERDPRGHRPGQG
jgi:hypothetical protein